MSDRERARLEWRSRVDAAARARHPLEDAARTRCYRIYSRLARGEGQDKTDVCPGCDADNPEWYETRCVHADAIHAASEEFYAALAAPKPWRSSRKPDARRRYSRSHRRGCWRCETVRGPRGILWYAMMRLSFGLTVLDPHGRRTR